MKTKMMQFGEQSPINIRKKQAELHSARASVSSEGLESNKYTEYDTEVKFENIGVSVNVTRVKDDDAFSIGVAKGALMAGVPVTVPSNTAASTMHAMKKRCDYKPQPLDMTSFKRGHALLMAKFEPLALIDVDKDLITKYLSKCAGGKAERLSAALASSELFSDMATKHVFAKQEALLKPHRAQPRIVYQGSDMYNAMTGPVVMELNDRMKKVFSLSNPSNKGNRVIYACGVSGEELGDVMESSAGVPIESDMKNNDGSQSAEFRKYEAMFYRKLGAPDWFVREFAKTTKIRVWTRYGVAATIEGQRWSGETTTTTGNSYVSMAIIQAAMERAEVTQSTSIHGGDDYLGYIVGDEGKIQASIESVTSASGMKAEVVPQAGRHHATFYRKRYVRSNIGTRPVPMFGRVLAKLNLRPNRNSAINDRDYMAGKYLCAAYEHRHVPIIRDLLLSTSEQLSPQPYLDVRTTKLQEMGDKDKIGSRIQSTPAHSVPEFDDFLQEVYDVSIDSLVELYQNVAQSTLDYCSGWCYVDKRGKIQNKKENSRYNPPLIGGDTAEALTRVDVGIE
jgi:hypothetical protein